MKIMNKEEYLKRNQENRCAISNTFFKDQKEVQEIYYNDTLVKVKLKYIKYFKKGD